VNTLGDIEMYHSTYIKENTGYRAGPGGSAYYKPADFNTYENFLVTTMLKDVGNIVY